MFTETAVANISLPKKPYRIGWCVFLSWVIVIWVIIHNPHWTRLYINYHNSKYHNQPIRVYIFTGSGTQEAHILRLWPPDCQPAKGASCQHHIAVNGSWKKRLFSDRVACDVWAADCPALQLANMFCLSAQLLSFGSLGQWARLRLLSKAQHHEVVGDLHKLHLRLHFFFTASPGNQQAKTTGLWNKLWTSRTPSQAVQLFGRQP